MDSRTLGTLSISCILTSSCTVAFSILRRELFFLWMIDEGAQTDLALELHEYDTSPSAEYESWMLLEPNSNTTEPGQ